jgi:uncharacterized membrane protein HdeD (DUF308 family)
MKKTAELLLMLPFLIMCWQFYSFAVSSRNEEKQQRCQLLGIVYMVLGILALVFHAVAAVVMGLLLIMMGLRLIAHGLERLDKSVYIDVYKDDR